MSRRSLLVLAAQAALAGGSGFPSARPVGPTFELDEIDLSNARQWVAVESDRCISFNSVDPFEDAAARVPGRFALAQQQRGQQEEEQQEVDPAAISVRALLLFAPLQWNDLRTAYRAFIHLDQPLVHGVSWRLTAIGLNATWNSKPISRTVAFNQSALNTNIRLNQIGFLPSYPKVAWLGQSLLRRIILLIADQFEYWNSALCVCVRV